MSRKIMILGAGLMQGPAIRSVRELGFESVVVDANPAAVCVPLADRFEPVDLKDTESLVKLADEINSSGAENGLAAVFTAGTDFSASVAAVAEHCGLPGHSLESCLNASNKIRMRKCFKSCGVPSPDFMEIDEAEFGRLLESADSIVFPKVIKPVDNMGGRGCRLIRNRDEFKPAVENAIRNSRSHKAVLEDFMDGSEFSIDSIVWNGTLTVTGFADRHIYYPPYFIETGHTMPSSVDRKIKNELIATFALGIKALGLTCGVAKADIKYTENGPMIGEIAARLSGGYMSGWTYPYSSDFPLTKTALSISAGMEPSFMLEKRIPVEWQPHSSVRASEQPFKLYEISSLKVSAERAWLSIPGKIKAETGFDRIKENACVKDILPRNHAGDTVSFPRNNVEKCGNIISVSSDRDSAVCAACSSVAEITLRLEPFNTDTDRFLAGMTEKDECGFPPSAYELPLSLQENEKKVLCKGERLADFIPACLVPYLDKAHDWNHCSLRKTIEKFDSLCPEHPDIDTESLWKALLRGGVQGAVYICDCGGKHENKI